MPSFAPEMHIMDWNAAKDYLPDYVSNNLPDGDPFQKRDKLHREINRMIKLGPKTNDICNSYIEGEIDTNTMNARLARISEEMADEKIDQFRSGLRELEEELVSTKHRTFIPFCSPSSIDVRNIENIAQELPSEDECYSQQNESVKKECY